MTDHIRAAARNLAARRLRQPVEDYEAVAAHPATTEADADAITAELGRLAQDILPPSHEAVQRMLDDASRAFVVARPGAERVEVLNGMLAGWYAAWPSTAVTDEHDGIARHLAALIDAAEARAVACPCLPGAPEHRHGVGGYAPDHPHTDPGDGRTECVRCGKYVWPVIHSCKGVPVTAAARARSEPPCFDCGQQEPDHVDGRCPQYRPAEREG
ncbi:hypothetical protein ACWER9_06600 [Micromonospora sp. NPDC003944]